MLCCSRPLRTTSCTSPSTSGAAWRCSSVQRNEPPRITNSCCLKNQSAMALPPSALALPTWSPATKILPCGSRRSSSWAPSISSCSKRSSNDSSERGEIAANTRGRLSAARFWASSTTTSRSSSEGTQPLARTSIWPMRTGTPSALLALVSIGSRHCWMWGRIAQCNASQAISSTLTAAAKITRTKRATHRRGAQPNGGERGAAGPVAGSGNAGGNEDMKISVRQPEGRQMGQSKQHAARRCGAQVVGGVFSGLRRVAAHSSI